MPYFSYFPNILYNWRTDNSYRNSSARRGGVTWVAAVGDIIAAIDATNVRRIKVELRSTGLFAGDKQWAVLGNKILISAAHFLCTLGLGGLIWRNEKEMASLQAGLQYRIKIES